ncbi:unnamed protein product [Rhizopus stolonifer]
MSINATYKDFKMPVGKGCKNLFYLQSAENWSFYEYFVSTHNDINKFKNFNAIKTDYKDDLDWIAQSDVPEEISTYAINLKKCIPDKAVIKATKAKTRPKCQINHQSIVIHGDNNFIHGNSFHTNETESSNNNSNHRANKRQFNNNVEEDEDKEEDKEEKSARKKGKMSEKEKASGIWKDWIIFLQNKENVKKFHPYSPEYHNVIRIGRTVSWRPNLDEELYQNHIYEKKDELFSIPACIVEYINSVVDSVSV